MEYKFTKHQIPRGSLPDAESHDKIFLFKNVSLLHATYQIRILTYLAQQKKKSLVIRVPEHFKPFSTLKAFLNEHKGLIKIEKVK